MTPKTAEIGRGEQGSGGKEYRKVPTTDVYCDIPSPGRSAGGHGSRSPFSAGADQVAYVQGLLKRLADLEARAAAMNWLSTPIELLNPDSRQQMPPNSRGPDGSGEENVSFMSVRRNCLWWKLF